MCLKLALETSGRSKVGPACCSAAYEEHVSFAVDCNQTSSMCCSNWGRSLVVEPVSAHSELAPEGTFCCGEPSNIRSPSFERLLAVDVWVESRSAKREAGPRLAVEEIVESSSTRLEVDRVDVGLGTLALMARVFLPQAWSFAAFAMRRCRSSWALCSICYSIVTSRAWASDFSRSCSSYRSTI